MEEQKKLKLEAAVMSNKAKIICIGNEDAKKYIKSERIEYAVLELLKKYHIKNSVRSHSNRMIYCSTADQFRSFGSSPCAVD